MNQSGEGLKLTTPRQGARLKDASIEQELRDIFAGISKVVSRGFSNAPFGSANSKPAVDIATAVLASLSKVANNGVAVSNDIAVASAGALRPAQADVEVVLQKLISERLVKVVVREDLRLYELTKAGKIELDKRAAALLVAEHSSEDASEGTRTKESSWINSDVIEAGKALATTLANASSEKSASIQTEIAKVLKDANVRIQEHLSKKD